MKFVCRNRYVHFQLLIAVFSALSCSSEQSEKKELRKFSKLESGNRYRIYRSVSQRSIPVLLQTLNSENQSGTVVKEEEVRLLLGFILSCSGKHSYALAESEIVLKKTENNAFRNAMHNLRSSIMYEKGWRRIAFREEQKAKTYHDSLQYLNHEKRFFILNELILAKKNIYKLDFSGAGFNFKSISDSSGIHWPYLLTEIIADIDRGNLDSAKQHYEQFKSNESIPEDVRIKSGKVIMQLLLKPDRLKKLELLPSDYFKLLLNGLRADNEFKILLRLVENKILPGIKD